ncbi:MAG: low affinity iron permease family protein [Polyangiales bacterium]
MSEILSRFSQRITEWVGSSKAFVIALLVIVIWAVTGPIFHYSDTWQLVINTGTTIVTFLMVFLIQRSQNKESLAIQLKLNEVVAALEGASNRLVGVEDLTEQDLQVLRKHYAQLASAAMKNDESLTKSHSVDEATNRQRWKMELRSQRQRQRQSGGE